MLTGKLVRVRFVRDRVVPLYIDATDSDWLEAAERLLLLFRGQEGRTRGELEEDQREAFGDDPNQLVHQGLAKLLEDRCEFEVVSGHPPEAIRSAIFQAAAEQRRTTESAAATPFDRNAVLAKVSTELGLTTDDIDRTLFADLKSEQRLVRVQDISAEHLLQRYNVALAQAVVLRAVKLEVTIRGEPPQRYRQLLRRVKFHRLVCEAERLPEDTHRLLLDGPLSLFTATQKYGLQLAMFLPAILLCHEFELEAEVRWGPERKLKRLLLSSEDGLVSHLPDTGIYVPPELQMFADLFRKRIEDWELRDETELFPLGGSYWVPDFRLIHRESRKEVLLEVLGFWRRSSAEQHLARLREHVKRPYLLAVSDQLRIDETTLEDLPAGIHRFRNMPQPAEIAKLASACIAERS